MLTSCDKSRQFNIKLRPQLINSFTALSNHGQSGVQTTASLCLFLTFSLSPSLLALPVSLSLSSIVVLCMHQLKPHQCFRTRYANRLIPRLNAIRPQAQLRLFGQAWSLPSPARPSLQPRPVARHRRSQAIFNFELIISMERQIS